MSKRKRPAVSDVLRQAIQESGLSMARLAKESGVPFSAIQRFMTNKTTITSANLDGLARYLGLELRRTE